MPVFNQEQFLWLVLLIVPGYVSYRVYSFRCPVDKLEFQKHFLDFFTVGIGNLLIWQFLVIPIVRTPSSEWNLWQVTGVGILVCFVSPVILGLAFIKLRRTILHNRLGIDHPTRRGWDYFFENNNNFFVLFKLKNGKSMGGYFGSRSFAATYPQEPEIYVEQVWRVDEVGKFVEEVEGSAGAVVRSSEWEQIEFFIVQKENDNGTQKTEGDSREQGDLRLRGSCGVISATGTSGQNAITTREDHSTARGLGDSPTTEQYPKT